MLDFGFAALFGFFFGAVFYMTRGIEWAIGAGIVTFALMFFTLWTTRSR